MPSSDESATGAAVIVGVGSGLGRALALRFAGAGHAVALAARAPDKLAPLVAEIEAAGGKVILLDERGREVGAEQAQDAKA